MARSHEHSAHRKVKVDLMKLLEVVGGQDLETILTRAYGPSFVNGLEMKNSTVAVATQAVELILRRGESILPMLEQMYLVAPQRKEELSAIATALGVTFSPAICEIVADAGRSGQPKRPSSLPRRLVRGAVGWFAAGSVSLVLIASVLIAVVRVYGELDAVSGDASCGDIVETIERVSVFNLPVARFHPICDRVRIECLSAFLADNSDLGRRATLRLSKHCPE